MSEVGKTDNRVKRQAISSKVLNESNSILVPYQHTDQTSQILGNSDKNTKAKTKNLQPLMTSIKDRNPVSALSNIHLPPMTSNTMNDSKQMLFQETLDKRIQNNL